MTTRPAGSATYGAAVSEHPDAACAVGEAAGAVLDAVGPGADVAFVFVSGAHRASIDEIARATQAILRPVVLCGCTASGVIGGPTEIEDDAAISIWAGHVGDVEAVRLEVVRSPDGTAVVGMPDEAAQGARTLILFADPFTVPVDAFLRAANEQYPDLQVVGGVVSSGPRTDDRLVLHDVAHADGAVGVLLPAGIDASVVVSQGCRPIGEPLIVTGAEGDLVTSLGSRPALERLRELVDGADERDRSLLARGLHVGVVVDESRSSFGPGDFLIRAVLGTDPGRGGIRIGADVAVGTTLQFHVRDADSAEADLAELLGPVAADAALLFTCNGRGTASFTAPNHDAEMVDSVLRGGALAGMLCAGEIGPVRGRNHLHGVTASMVLFSEAAG